RWRCSATRPGGSRRGSTAACPTSTSRASTSSRPSTTAPPPAATTTPTPTSTGLSTSSTPDPSAPPVARPVPSSRPDPPGSAAAGEAGDDRAGRGERLPERAEALLVQGSRRRVGLVDGPDRGAGRQLGGVGDAEPIEREERGA